MGHLTRSICVAVIASAGLAQQPPAASRLDSPPASEAIRRNTTYRMWDFVKMNASVLSNEKLGPRLVERAKAHSGPGVPGLDDTNKLVTAMLETGLPKLFELDASRVQVLETRLTWIAEDDQRLLKGQSPAHFLNIEEWAENRITTGLDLAAKAKAIASDGVYCEVEVATIDPTGSQRTEVQNCDVEYVPEPVARTTERWPTFDKKSSTTTQRIEAGYYLMRTGKLIGNDYRRGKEKAVWVDRAKQSVDLDAPTK